MDPLTARTRHCNPAVNQGTTKLDKKLPKVVLSAIAGLSDTNPSSINLSWSHFVHCILCTNAWWAPTNCGHVNQVLESSGTEPRKKTTEKLPPTSVRSNVTRAVQSEYCPPLPPKILPSMSERRFLRDINLWDCLVGILTGSCWDLLDMGVLPGPYNWLTFWAIALCNACWSPVLTPWNSG